MPKYQHLLFFKVNNAVTISVKIIFFPLSLTSMAIYISQEYFWGGLLFFWFVCR